MLFQFELIINVLHNVYALNMLNIADPNLICAFIIHELWILVTENCANMIPVHVIVKYNTCILKKMQIILWVLIYYANVNLVILIPLKYSFLFALQDMNEFCQRPKEPKHYFHMPRKHKNTVEHTDKIISGKVFQSLI